MNGMALNNHVIKHKQVKQGVCEIQCFRNPDCVSYNYGTQIDGSFLCELNNKTHLQVPDELQARNGFIYRPISVSKTSFFGTTIFYCKDKHCFKMECSDINNKKNNNN